MSSAASFVDPINAEYREVVKAERAALPHAIKCGELLNLAKENVKAEKMKWGEWLKVNCPDVTQETASLYMRYLQSTRNWWPRPRVSARLENFCRKRSLVVRRRSQSLTLRSPSKCLMTLHRSRMSLKHLHQMKCSRCSLRLGTMTTS
jgi:hypothetical protein